MQHGKRVIGVVNDSVVIDESLVDVYHGLAYVSGHELWEEHLPLGISRGAPLGEALWVSIRLHCGDCAKPGLLYQ